MKYAFAGDRKISVIILEWLIKQGYKPSALFVTDKNKNTHADELIEISGLPEELVFWGKDFGNQEKLLRSMDLDYIFGIHFPYIIPGEILSIPKIGFLNLHPAYLPYNKGWNTPSWAIIDKTPYGATLHFMTENLDEGDVIHQLELEISPNDNANSLYQRVLDLEIQVFKEAFPMILAKNPDRKVQVGAGTSYLKRDLKKVQEIDLNKTYTGENLINLIRGLTTNNIEEGAYFVKHGKRFYLQMDIIEEKEAKDFVDVSKILEEINMEG